jgi:peptidoglycan/LPS O-acetylase OafA/YrhL
MRPRWPQVDVIKGFAIIAVVLLHALPRDILISSWAVLHIWQAVPVFFIGMGFVQGLSVQQAFELPDPPRGIRYSREYVAKAFNRYLVPLVPVYAISLLGIWVASRLHPSFEMYLGPLNLLGKLPSEGPGNYFISILLQTIVVLPILSYAMSRRPGGVLLACFALDLAFELSAPHWVNNRETRYLYSSAIFRYLFAIGLGYWIALVPFKAQRNVICGAIGSLAYLVYSQVTGFQFPFFSGIWGTQNLFSAFYPAALVLLGLIFLPKKCDSPPLRLVESLGRASYQIFLVQLLWYRFFVYAYLDRLAGNALERHYPFSLMAYVVVSATCCLAIGYGWYRLEPRKLVEGALRNQAPAR